jgi:hypothetical protein
LRWWLVAADSLRRGDPERRVKLGSLLVAVLGLRIIQARIRKLRRGLRVAATLQHGGVEDVLRQHFMGRLIGVRIYRRLRRWAADHQSRWAAERWRAL